MSSILHRLTVCICFGLSILILASGASIAQGATAAQFSLATAGGASTTIAPGQNLSLQLWVNLTGDPLPGDVMGYSFYLQPSSTGIITFDTSSFSSALPAFQPLSAYANNSPKTGEFDRAMGSVGLPPTGIPFTMNTPTLLATFTIKGLSQGTVNYAFASNEPYRTWTFNYQDPMDPILPMSTAVAATNPAMTIVVTPEPGIAAMMLVALVFAGWRRPGRPLA